MRSPVSTTDLAVDVVIPVRNAADRIASAVASVLDQDKAPQAVVLAMAPSTDGTEDVVRRLVGHYPSVSVVANPSGRTAAGLNAAIATTTSPIVARVDAGSVLPSSYLSRAIATLEATGAANVGAVQVSVGTTPFERAVSAASLSRFGVGGAGYRLGGGEPRPTATAYLGVFRRDALARVGGFDEAFIRNQDAELNWRLQHVESGVWLDPELQVEYRPRSSLTSLMSQYHQYGEWRARTIRKHPESLLPRQLAAPALVGALGVTGLLALAGRTGPLQLLAAVYGGATLAASATAGGEVSATERLLLVMVFPGMHLAWGSGFLRSLIRMVPWSR